MTYGGADADSVSRRGPNKVAGWATVERSALATGQAPGSVARSSFRGAAGSSHARGPGGSPGEARHLRIYRIHGAPGELPGRTQVTERAAAVGLRLAGLEVKPGSLAEACGVPNIPRIGHNASDDRVHSRTGAYAGR